MFKGFILGIVLTLAAIAGGTYYYLSSGMAPAATSDPPLPFEKRLANMALDAHIEHQHIGPSPVPADETTYLAGADVYKDNCAMCHGLPNQVATPISRGMYPPPPQLFRGKGVTDDPASETYWKVANGIRLTGMPSFQSDLNNTQMWQVAELLANANKISEKVREKLVPATPAPIPPPKERSPAKGAPAPKSRRSRNAR
jgi:thiosulfate dehydrogenase